MNEIVRERLIHRAMRKSPTVSRYVFEAMTDADLRRESTYAKANVTHGRGYKLAVQAYGWEGFIERVKDARMMGRADGLREGIAKVIKDARRATAKVKTATEEQRLVTLASELFGDTDEATVEALRLALVRTGFLEDK